jgi:hypothetical protein
VRTHRAILKSCHFAGFNRGLERLEHALVSEWLGSTLFN